MKSMWKRCRNPDEWFCDECRHCTAEGCNNCGPDGRRKWMKHMGDDISLCDVCWETHHEKYDKPGAE